MVSISPYYTGKEPRDVTIYVMQFPNPFDMPDEAKDESDRMTVRNARDQFLRIYKTNDKNEEKQIIPQISEDSIHWLRDGLTDEDKKQTITRKDFLKAVISSVLYTLKNELHLDYYLLQSRDKDEIFCEISVSEAWLKEKAVELEYQLQFQEKEKNKEAFQMVSPYGPATLLAKNNGKNLNIFKLYDENDEESTEKRSLFTRADKARIVISELIKRLDLHALKRFNVMTEDFCIHHDAPLDKLKDSWASFSKLLKPQPLDDIRKYFSEKIALYFA